MISWTAQHEVFSVSTTHQNPCSTAGIANGLQLGPYIASVLTRVTTEVIQKKSPNASLLVPAHALSSLSEMLRNSTCVVRSKSFPGAIAAFMAFTVSDAHPHAPCSPCKLSPSACSPSRLGRRIRFANSTMQGEKDRAFELRSTAAARLGELTTYIFVPGTGRVYIGRRCRVLEAS